MDKHSERQRARNLWKWCHSFQDPGSSAELVILNPTVFPQSMPVPIPTNGAPPILNGYRPRITDDSPEQSDVDDTVYNQAEIKRLTKAVQKFADGKDKYQEVVYQLKKDKLWFGSYYSLKNLQVIHQFFTMRALRSKSEEEGPDGRVKLTIEDVDWWVRSGPQLGAAVIWSDDSNCPNQRNRKVAEKKAQLEHYINSVTSGGPMCNSVKTYEKEAKRLGVHPWSGYLIDVIVAMAQDLEDDETMTKHDSSRTLLDSSCLQDACARMFTRRV